MNKREKIIVLIAVLIGGYGLLDYLFFSNSNDTEKKMELATHKNQTEEFATRTASDLLMVETTIQKIDLPFLMERIESKWTKDPFKRFKAPVIKNEIINEETQNIPELTYSGFIQIGDQFMAVINEMEYETGETIKEGGLKIRQIMPGKVVLQTKSKKDIIVFLEEN